MPLPLNQRTNRLWMGFSLPAGTSAAYAVPCELNIETSGGSPTSTCEPAAVSPFRMARRESLTRFVISCDMDSPSCIWKFSRSDHRDDHFFKMKTGFLEIV